MNQINIGSRASELAIAQSIWVKQRILENFPNYSVNIITMSTKGDRILDKPLAKIGGKGLFTAELETALRSGEIDLAVHSLKDMPQQMAQGLPIIAYSKREDVRDCLIYPQKGKKPIKLIGSSSLRRAAQLKELYPNAICNSIRGNVQTRLKKLEEGEFDAIVLAAAGIKRLGMEGRIGKYFDAFDMIPAAGQGILAIQGKECADLSFLKCIDDDNSRYQYKAESAFIRALGASCTSPVGAYAIINGNKLSLFAMLAGDDLVAHKSHVEGDIDAAEDLGFELAQRMQEVLDGKR